VFFPTCSFLLFLSLVVSDYTVLKPNKASHHLAGIKPTSCNHQRRAQKEMPVNMRRNQAPSHKLINFELKDATAQGSLPILMVQTGYQPVQINNK
jgi:hypothetical protein